MERVIFYHSASVILYITEPLAGGKVTLLLQG